MMISWTSLMPLGDDAVSDTCDTSIIELVELIQSSSRAIAFTGAGISTESGIEDFRSPGGLWTRNKPVLFQDFLADDDERRRFWRMRKELIPTFLNAAPNAGHRALVELELRGRIHAVITQNIDELHQRAGSRKVVEVHGTAMKVHCLTCDKRWLAEEIQVRLDAGEEEFVCDECGGRLKSMTVSFGQDLPPAVWDEAAALSMDCDLFVSLGSSLVVHPAAALPEVAKRRGAKLVIINREPTPLDPLADLVINAPIGETMTAALQRLA
ncbi:MAG: NAD-dependent deacylase [Chloroflexota bacterium]